MVSGKSGPYKLAFGEKGKNRNRSNGYVLWEGPSPQDGKPIVVITTGLRRPSKNTKTGPMVQTLVIRQDINPAEAATTGQDESVCNQCPLRQHTVQKLSREGKVSPGSKSPMCYVNTRFAIKSIFEGYRRGIYPRLRLNEYARTFVGRKVRLGAYGNFSNVPLRITERVIRYAKAWTLYEHNWRAKHAQPLRQYAMASVSSLQEKEEAKALGWRTFRVKRPGEAVQSDEVICPAAEEGGKKTSCDKCLLCQGTSKRAKSVVIDDHGPTSLVHAQKTDFAMVQLGYRTGRRTES